MKQKKNKNYSKRGLELGHKIVTNFPGRKRIKTYTLEEIKKHISVKTDHFIEPELLGERKIKTRRAKVYFEKGFECVRDNCSVEGLFFVVELSGNPPNGQERSIHLDLYGTEDGEDVLMTIDHIHPKAKGGKDRVENYQPMCIVCNSIKGSDVE